MAFNWLDDFQRGMEKPENYAQKTLAAYRLGMKARGSIVGVRIETEAAGCEAARALDPTVIYHPDDALHLPLPDCPLGRKCTCVYRPVMQYEVDENWEADQQARIQPRAKGKRGKRPK